MLFATNDTSADEAYAGLGSGDHLFVWAWRRIAFGRAACPLLAQEFADTFGEESADVFAALHLFVDIIARASSYQLSLGMPGGFMLTRDEERVLSLVAAAQAIDPFAFRQSLEQLVKPGQRHEVSIAARALAKAFGLNGVDLKIPDTGMAMICPQQALAS